MLLLALCLVGQPALAQLVPACAHASASAADEHAHHGHHDSPETDEAPARGCDCGCTCASLACAHGGVTLALPVVVDAERVALAGLPQPPRRATGATQALPDTPLRPPNRA